MDEAMATQRDGDGMKGNRDFGRGGNSGIRMILGLGMIVMGFDCAC